MITITLAAAAALCAPAIALVAAAKSAATVDFDAILASDEPIVAVPQRLASQPVARSWTQGVAERRLETSDRAGIPRGLCEPDTGDSPAESHQHPSGDEHSPRGVSRREDGRWAEVDHHSGPSRRSGPVGASWGQ